MSNGIKKANPNLDPLLVFFFFFFNLVQSNLPSHAELNPQFTAKHKMSDPQQSNLVLVPTTPPTPPPPPTNNTITLHVGERRFTTRLATLTSNSTFFAWQLSSRWALDAAQSDGSYFIDADGDVFAHVLRYLRHGIFPVFYDEAKGGHDYAMYVAVLEQARYFGVEPLRVWLEGGKYLAAVKVEREGRRVVVVEEGDVGVGSTMGAVVRGNVAVEHHVGWVTRKVYVCPRGIGVHRGNRNACGKDCRRVQGGADDEYEDEAVMKVFEVRKTTTLDPKMCVEHH